MHGQSDALDAQALARTNEQLREQQDAISSVLRAVVRSAELQPVLDEVTTAAMRLCAGQYGILYLAEGDLLHAVAGLGGVYQWEYDKSHPHAFDRTTWAGRTAQRERSFTSPTSFWTPSTPTPGRVTGTELDSESRFSSKTS